MSPVSSFDPDALRRARLAAGLTQSQLAHRIGVAGAERISMWERGEVPPGSAARLRALGRALKVPPDTFLTTPTVHAEDETDFLRLRIHAGISREDLARRAGVSVGTVYEHRRANERFRAAWSEAQPKGGRANGGDRRR